jgi:hypothetical protein
MTMLVMLVGVVAIYWMGFHLVKGKKGISCLAAPTTESPASKTRFEQWCDFRINDIAAKPDIRGMNSEKVAKGLCHLVGCDQMYQMRQREAYWQECINQLRDAHGDSSASLSNMLFMMYDESSEEMLHNADEKRIIARRLSLAVSPFDKVFWLTVEYMEHGAESQANMKMYISKCAAL